MVQKNVVPTKRQAEILQRRGMDPKNYTVIRTLNFSFFVRDKRDGSVRIIDKRY